MTAPPLPASPCLRCRLDYTQDDAVLGGSRFYLSYTGSAPTAGNCATIATDIQTAWGANLAELVGSDWIMTEVDVLDIASDAGASGNWTGETPGTLSGTAVAAQVSMNVEFDIARRYRGGKPRMFLPPADDTKVLNPSHWDGDFVTLVNTQMTSFFAAIAALDVGSVGTLAHVNLSYYKGFTNITNSSGRERAVPTYRDTALLDTVTGYSAKGVMGSQKRRRIATTY